MHNLKEKPVNLVVQVIYPQVMPKIEKRCKGLAISFKKFKFIAKLLRHWVALLMHPTRHVFKCSIKPRTHSGK